MKSHWLKCECYKAEYKVTVLSINWLFYKFMEIQASPESVTQPVTLVDTEQDGDVIKTIWKDKNLNWNSGGKKETQVVHRTCCIA